MIKLTKEQAEAELNIVKDRMSYLLRNGTQPHDKDYERLKVLKEQLGLNGDNDEN